MSPPDGLLTFGNTKLKHDVEVDVEPHASDPLLSDDCFDVFTTLDLVLLTANAELNMNTSEDEPSSGLNGRLRPRKPHPPSPPNKLKPKLEGKTAQDKPKRTTTPSKALPNKQNDLSHKSDFSPTPQFLCPYCDRKFASKQTISKHFRRVHFSSSKQDSLIGCLFCNHTESELDIIRHMIDNHPNQYFACLDCHTRFPSTTELAEHKLNVCEKQKASFATKPRVSRGNKKSKKTTNIENKDRKDFQDGHGFNGIVISCELKPSEVQDGADIEDNITTNLILPPSKNLGSSSVLEKNAVIVLDDIQWNKRIPSNFAFHNTDADQILSRLGVVHRSSRTGESTRKDLFKNTDESTQKFEKCFDTKFYSKVASNVQENLNKFLDGSFNFNPDPDSTIKTRKSKNIVVINTAEGFPILLACEQYSRSVLDSYLPRTLAPKHKWKWENLDTDKTLVNPDQIKRDSHTNKCIITLISSLDIWTQLSMRKKFEEKYNSQPLGKKTEKQNIISKELKDILESREIPKTSQAVIRSSKPGPSGPALDFPASLGLTPAPPTYEVQPAVLSGEWVRPRCYVCCACGEQTNDPKGLSSHISNQHPNTHVQYYEIVGEQLLHADIFKHLYVPPSQVCNRTRPPRGFRDCTKCKKSITLEDLHQHMLDCAGDTPAVRRRQCRSRPFGVRRRRARMPDNTIRKKIRKEIRSRHRRQKAELRPRQRIRTEVGDAETIRKMIADLPAKRHRVLVNPVTMLPRQRRQLEKRNQLVRKKNSLEMVIRKRVPRNSSFIDGKARVTSNDETNTNLSNIEDEEDNKPLKPKPKLKSIIQKKKQQREALKRQTILSRARRKSARVEKKKQVENKDNDALGSSDNNSIAFFDDSPQKLDVKRGAYNTRESANRGSSNNRDDQRPGCSGTNGNARANNSCAPTQNVPLKHSIARLTANSETHDKSVQFHHSFLVQQECNNTNQHVPSGQHTLFENEAVVSRLDKPPLNFSQKGLLDLQAFQKSKLNKPRKGLNDCIAMLKNKLVEPVSFEGTGHVSVQCGSDEPIDLEPRHITEGAIPMDANIIFDLQRGMVHRSEVQGNSTGYHYYQDKEYDDPSGHVISERIKNTKEVVQNKASRDKNASVVENELSHEEKVDPLKVGRNTELLQLTEKSTTDKTIPKTRSQVSSRKKLKSTSESNNMTDELRSSETMIKDGPAVSSPLKLRSFDSRSKIDKGQVEAHVLPLHGHQNETLTKNTKSSSTGPSKTKLVPVEKSVEKNETVIGAPAVSSALLIKETDSNIPHVASRLPKEVSGEMHKKKDSIRPEIVMQLNEPKVNWQKEMVASNTNMMPHDICETTKHPNVYTQNPVNIYTEQNVDVQKTVECFPDRMLVDIPVRIPPAHASTNIDSIISTPLDLSSKMVNSRNQSYHNMDGSYLYDYDNCETLDLSNKNTPKTCDLLADTIDDGIVDLRVRPPESRNLPNTLDLCVKPAKNRSGHVSDIPETVHTVDILPTDLSMRTKDAVVYYLAEEKASNENVVHDLSSKSVPKHCDRDVVPVNAIITAPTLFSEKIERVVEHSMSNRKLDSPEKERSRPMTLVGVKDSEPKISTESVNEFCSKDNTKKQNDPSPFPGLKVDSVFGSAINVPHLILENKPLVAQQPYVENISQFPKHINEPSSIIHQFRMQDNVDSNNMTILDLTDDPADTMINTTPILETQGTSNPSTSMNYIRKSRSTVSTVNPYSTCEITSAISKKIDRTTAVNTSPNTQHAIGTKTESMVPNVSPKSLLNNSSTITDDSRVKILGLVERPDKCGEGFGKESASNSPVCQNALSTPNQGNVCDASKVQGVENINVYAEKLDQDPETARKIAMLPKALVDILGNMPVDHRNQLLNVLPQFVSNAATSSDSIKSAVESDMNLTKEDVSPADRIKNVICQDDSASRILSASTSNNLPSTTFTHLPHAAMVSELAANKSDSESSRIMPPIKAPSELGVQLISKQTGDNIPKTCPDDLFIDKDSIHSKTGIVIKTDKAPECASNKVIDLTEDESLPLNLNAANITEATQKIAFSTQDVAACTKFDKTTSSKRSSDKTASLRAVRIKAPSERQKENEMLKRISVEQLPPQNITIGDDNEVNKSSESIKSLAIQQAEVSSTQHSNKAVALDSKYTAECIPPDFEICADNSSTKMRRVSTPSTEVVIDKSTCVTKSGLVTSSNTASSVANQSSVPDVKKDTEKIKVNAIEANQTSDEVLPAKDDHIIKEPEREEDSDDDIILAAIVKQKQNSDKMNTHNNKKVSAAKKKKKVKKLKKTVTAAKKKSENGDEGLLEGVSERNEVGNNKNLNSSTNENIDKGTERACIHKATEKDENNGISDILKQDNTTTDMHISGNKVQTKSNRANDRISELPKHISLPGKATVLNLQEETRTKFIQENNIETQKEKCNKKSRQLKVIDNEVSDRNNLKISDQLTTTSAVEIVENKTQAELKISGSPQRSKGLNNENLIDEENTSSNNSKVGDVKTDIELCREIDENVGAPLRRSRRGKSLYLDRHSSENEFLAAGYLDQKPPFTKKQLIFSKLLLDVENHNRNQSSEKAFDAVEDDKLNGDIPNEVVSCISEKNNTDCVTEKVKPVKRKKSPQLKAKVKKKKSTRLTSSAEDVVSTDDSQIDNKDMSKIKDSSDKSNQIKESIEVQEDVGFKQEDKQNFDIDKSKSISISNDDDNASIINNIVVDEVNKTSSAEKRKFSNVTNKIDSTVTSKPKKTKLHKHQDCGSSELDDSIKDQTDVAKTGDAETCANRATTCYYAPIAARSTRSKSVVLKTSTGELYDPYDIDCDEMIEKEGINKSTSRSKKSKNILPKSDINTCNNSQNEKSHIPTNTAREKNSSKVSKEISNLSPEEAEKIDISKKDNSDSDDSSKSDVPLTKYLEEKVKKNANFITKIDTNYMGGEIKEHSNDNINNEKIKKCKYLPSNITAPKTTETLNESEEQLRSEQFMESFGFFSERKPRKSNLLATKKISETFHIIANENDDLYFNTKERSSRKASHNEGKKLVEVESSGQHFPSKQYTKRGRKKKGCTKIEPCYCHLCKREYRRPDNFVRHQMSLYHVSKLCEIELKMETIPFQEEPNYLIAYKQQLDRLKHLKSKLTKEKRRKHSKSKVLLPTLDEIFVEVKRTVRQQQLSGRDLSRDEALFIDCCEMLKESHKPEVPIVDPVIMTNNLIDYDRTGQSSTSDLLFISKTSDSKSDGDVDSITAKTILESEEVRNLENDLISGLKEAANANTSKNRDYLHNACHILAQCETGSASFSSHRLIKPNCDQIKSNDEDYEVPIESEELHKSKKYPETKDKMYPDVEDIDMFEDKFDKIKRKCRSQAAAAKQLQTIVKPSSGHKGRKKSDKKKGKKSSKKNYQNTVLTKGALKGFDGIKVSIPTSDINISAIVPRHDCSPKKKKKTSTKKRREKKNSETSSKYDSDHRFKDSPQKKLDVYEFMDNEDAELFEFRPSTLMERFKSITSKDTPSTSKRDAEELDNSSESASDGDDFVYMSDDYVCSDDETEDSIMSYEQGMVKNDTKKSCTLKRKDVVEKNAVMGKIFKHNAVRSEKKSIKGKEIAKPKANLDQLFDSLLEDEPNCPKMRNKSDPTIQEETDSLDEEDLPGRSENQNTPIKDSYKSEKKNISVSEKTKSLPKNTETSLKLSADITKKNEYELPPKKVDYSSFDMYGPSTSKQFDLMFPKDCQTSTQKKHDYSSSKNHEEATCSKYLDPQSSSDDDDNDIPEIRNKSSNDVFTNIFESNTEFEDDAGVARQRARRKCTVGKQNVLAETWSSESEPDGIPPRPNSAESVVAGAGRKKKCRKKESQNSSGRRGKVTVRKIDSENRLTGNPSGSSASGHSSSASGRVASGESERNVAEENAADEIALPPAPAAPPPGNGNAGGSKPRPRPPVYYWAAEAGDEQEHLQQHGWIVGDSHKKLVTMLAHAKGRKRNNDDRRHMVE